MNNQLSSISHFLVNVLAVLVVLGMLLMDAPEARCQNAASGPEINSLGDAVSGLAR